MTKDSDDFEGDKEQGSVINLPVERMPRTREGAKGGWKRRGAKSFVMMSMYLLFGFGRSFSGFGRSLNDHGQIDIH